MKKEKVLFIYRYEALDKILSGDDRVSSPDEFLWGMNHLDRNRFEVRYVNISRDAKRKGIRKLTWFLEFPFAKLTKIGLPTELFFLFKKEIMWADHIVCVNDQISLGILFWRLWGKLKSKIVHCIVMSLQERIKYFKWNLPLVWLVGQLLRQADTIFTLSRVVIDDFVKNYHLVGKRIEPLYFGIDIMFWHLIVGMEKSDFILSVGNDMNRDFKTLVEALPDDMRLKLVTKQEVNVGSKSIEKMSGVSNQVLLELYNKALIVVIPSIYLKHESSGLSCVLQAMVCGAPVIVSDAPPLRELFTHGEHCLFYTPEDRDSLSQAIIHLKSDKQLRDKLSQQALALVKNRFSSLSMGEKIASVVAN